MFAIGSFVKPKYSRHTVSMAVEPIGSYTLGSDILRNLVMKVVGYAGYPNTVITEIIIPTKITGLKGRWSLDLLETTINPVVCEND